MTRRRLERFQQAQAGLGGALQRLLVVTENYPELKANQNFLALQDQLEGTENRISVERKRFNDQVQGYNTYIKQFPRMIIANIAGFDEKPYFESAQGAETAPKVEFLTMADFKFSKEEIEGINRAAAHVESVSSGEVLTAVIRESSNYAAPELLFSVIGGFVYYLIALGFHTGIEAAVSNLFWTPQAWHVTAFYGASTMLVVGILYVLTNIPGFDRLIVPKAVISKHVHRRALVHFTESGAVNTRDRTGILFFISLRERRVEIIADEGINSRVGTGAWDEILNNLLAAIRRGEAAAGLEQAIMDCAGILEQHFPVKNDDVNELPDGIVFLED